MTARSGSSRRSRRLAATAFVWVALLALPACRVTVRTDVAATWSGTGTLTVRVVLDEPARAALSALGIGADVFSDAATTTTAAASGTTAAPEAAPEPFADLETAGWVVHTQAGAVVLEHAFGDPGQLSSLAAQVSGDVTPPLFSEMALSVDAGLFVSRVALHATVTPTNEMVAALAARGLAAPPSVAELERALGVPVAEAFRFVFAISLPGREVVTTEPADAPAAGANAWEVPVGTTLDVRATTSARTPAFWVALVSIGLAILIASSLAALEIVARRRAASRTRTHRADT